MATIVHFDISAEQPERAKAFYEGLFGWTFHRLPGPGGYYLIETKDLDGNRGIGGGMAQREHAGQTHITQFVGVSSVEETLKNVVALGGAVVQRRQTIPGWGYLAVCLDSEKNTFGIFQEDTTASIPEAEEYRTTIKD